MKVASLPCTVGSRLSEPRLSESRLSVSVHLDISSGHNVFGTSGKKTFCVGLLHEKAKLLYKQFFRMLQCFFHALRDLDHNLQHPS